VAPIDAGIERPRVDLVGDAAFGKAFASGAVQVVVHAQHQRVDEMFLRVVAILARGTPLAAPAACRRLIRQRAAREVVLRLLPAFLIRKEIVIEAKEHRLLRGRPEFERGVDALPLPLDVVEKEVVVLRDVEAVLARSRAVRDAIQLGVVASMSGLTALVTSSGEMRSAGTESIDTPRVPNSAGVPTIWPLLVRRLAARARGNVHRDNERGRQRTSLLVGHDSGESTGRLPPRRACGCHETDEATGNAAQ
jgi:hypothetical protein